MRKSLFAENAEEAFDEIDPRRVGRGVVEMHTRVPREPPLGGGVLVNIQIVEDDMEIAAWKRGHHGIHESQENHRRPAVPDLRHDFAARRVEGREQRLRPMADVFVRPRPRPSGPQRQAGEEDLSKSVLDPDGVKDDNVFDEDYAIVLTTAQPGSIPAKIWRASHIIYL